MRDFSTIIKCPDCGSDEGVNGVKLLHREAFYSSGCGTGIGISGDNRRKPMEEEKK